MEVVENLICRNNKLEFIKENNKVKEQAFDQEKQSRKNELKNERERALDQESKIK